MPMSGLLAWAEGPCDGCPMGKGMRCRLGLHRWANRWDHERSMAIKECELCGSRIAKGIPSNTSGAPKGGPFPPGY